MQISNFQREMPKNMQGVVLFIESDGPYRTYRYSTPSKIGNLFMNRFAIEEDQGHEILRIFEQNYGLAEGKVLIEFCCNKIYHLKDPIKARSIRILMLE